MDIEETPREESYDGTPVDGSDEMTEFREAREVAKDTRRTKRTRNTYSPPSEEDGKKRKETISIVIGGVTTAKSVQGQDLTDFVCNFVDEFCEFKTNAFLDTTFVKVKKAKALTFSLSKVWHRDLGNWIDIRDPKYIRMVKVVLTFVRPKISDNMSKMLIDIIINSDRDSYHHVMTYFQNIDEKKGTESKGHAFKQLMDCLTFANEDYRDYYTQLIEVFFVGMVWNIFRADIEAYRIDDKYPHRVFDATDLDAMIKKSSQGIDMFPGCMIICGRAGIGKSNLIKRILPLDLTKFLVKCSGSLPSTQTVSSANYANMEMLKGCIIADLEDATPKWLRQFASYCKSSLELTFWNYRNLYDTNNSKLQRRFTPMLTSNEVSIIYDQTGNRRIFPIYLYDIDRDAFNSIDKEALFGYFFSKMKEQKLDVLSWYDRAGEALDRISEMHIKNDFTNKREMMKLLFIEYPIEENEMEVVKDACRILIAAKDGFLSYIALFLHEEDCKYIVLPYSVIVEVIDTKTADEAKVGHFCKNQGVTTFTIRVSDGDKRRYMSLAVIKKHHTLELLLNGYAKRILNDNKFELKNMEVSLNINNTGAQSYGDLLKAIAKHGNKRHTVEIQSSIKGDDKHIYDPNQEYSQ